MLSYIDKDCDICGNSYKYDSRQKVSKYCSQRCRSLAQRQKSITGEEGIDYVVCKICNYKFKEINNDHLSTHNISSLDYDKKYGNNQRTSEKTRRNKDTLSSLMTPELSKKLSNSHKKDAYIKKYGEVEGLSKYNDLIKKLIYSNGIDYYIDKYGEEGREIYNDIQKKKVISLDNQIKKHGEKDGIERYNNWLELQKIKSTLPYFIKIYGEELGLKNWLEKNDKISVANSKIPISDRKLFYSYISEVNKYTRISLSINKLLMIELRGVKNGYDLDHIVSKVNGFRNNIPPYIIGHISNLRIIDSSYNRKKQHNSEKEISEIANSYDDDFKYKKLVNDINKLK
jgi:hypothetical protein